MRAALIFANNILSIVFAVFGLGIAEHEMLVFRASRVAWRGRVVNVLAADPQINSSDEQAISNFVFARFDLFMSSSAHYN